jgi:hypothetical protein
VTPSTASIGPSLIRTYVPAVIGAALAWLATLGLNVNNDTRTLVVTALTAVLTGAYYTLARLLERKYPALSLLLGSPVQPTTYGVVATTPGPAAIPPGAAPPVV